MADTPPSPHGPLNSSDPAVDRGAWGSRLGFVMAAVGSAVGLGNMWRFPYITSEGGGAAFVVLYIFFTFIVALPIALGEFSLGRGTRSSPIGALRIAGGRGWSMVGYLFVLAGFTILSYYSVIAGWVTRYMLEATISGFPSDLGAHFQAATQGVEPIIYHLVFMILTITIVMGGVEKGIERASLLMMPALAIIVGGLAIYAFTLDGSGAGYEYYLSPSFAELFEMQTIARAAGQAFFSMSLGMGAMLTFSSYLSKDVDMPKEGVLIAMSDFTVAFLAGLVVFPVIFALGLQGSVGESAVGALFISIPGAFAEMGGVGRVIGALFFTALFFGAITSAISLLEVVTSSVIDEFRIPRKRAAIGAGVIIALIGLIPAMNLDALGAMDAIASEIFLPLGGLITAIFVGWFMKNPRAEVETGASPLTKRMLVGWLAILRFVVPVLLVIVLVFTIPNGVAAVRALFGGG